MPSSDPVKLLLERVRAGDAEASAELFELVYGDLRARARALMAGAGGAPETLQTTALVHEAWLKLRGPGAGARDRAHFMAVAAKAMRSVLVDAARRRGALKRGGKRMLLEEALDLYAERVPDVAELHEELELLSELDERLAKIVEMRFFGGLTVGEVAEVLGLGHATVERDWRSARAWLAARLRPDGGESAD